ncbi:hypothetical protein BRADI_3g09032v3 [Brachypodium distachyon]|uniref:Uncharacterized protein n=1 Tax=Brachypodium distachyon TaxID=15368 RepID=A0A2K2CW51_BRADI|nr:hypothetical protein BRADI_3g09032v3 [Brachypodium distachyon]
MVWGGLVLDSNALVLYGLNPWAEEQLASCPASSPSSPDPCWGPRVALPPSPPSGAPPPAYLGPPDSADPVPHAATRLFPKVLLCHKIPPRQLPFAPSDLN